MINKLLIFFFIFLPTIGFSAYDPCKYLKLGKCSFFHSSKESSGSRSVPTKSDGFTLNPANLPISKGFGVFVQQYRDQRDYGLASGFEKIGAGLSPKVGDGNFFGMVGFEEESDYIQRVRDRKKFDSKKTALMFAVNLAGISKSGKPKLFVLNLGVILKYHKIVKQVRPGVGLVGQLGPLNMGIAAYKDDNYNALLKNNDQFTGYNFNLGLSYLFLFTDYSYAKKPGNIDVYLWSNSIILWDFIFTYAHRTEYSDRLKYIYHLDQFYSVRRKDDKFYGIQYRPIRFISFGWFKNYNLLRGDTYMVSLFL